MKRIIFLFAFLCSYLGYSQVVDTTLYSIGDAQTSSASPSTPNGTIGTMDVSKTASSVFRSFVKFKLDTLPANAVITSAILRLTPSGTEGITSPNSSQLYVDICNSSWTETGITHASNISNNTLFQTVTSSSIGTVSGKREFDVKNIVQAIMDGRLPNQGFRIRRNDETTTATTTYYTRENGTQNNRPQLVIQYYLRPSVSAVTIVHTSSLNGTDGSISPTIINGSNTTMTCRWFNSSGTQIATTQNLTGVGKGWYGLKYYGTTAGDTSYQAFIVGTECEDVTITFNPGPNYIDDSRFSDFVSGSGTTAINYPQANNGSNVLLMHERWTNGGVWYNARDILKFRLWVDPSCQVNSAIMTLVGNAHNPLQTTNASELLRVTSPWTESGVAHINMPTSTTTGKINIAGLSGNANATIDIAPFFNIWKTNNTSNYGLLFQLQSPAYSNNSYTRMQFHSSDATTASNRPQIAFSIKVNTCDLSRKGTPVITYDANNSYGDVSLTITPVSTAVPPYHYMISEQPIPNFSSIYHSYQYGDIGAAFKDTVLIDSATFFNTGNASLTKSFPNMAMGQYYISVFDKLGVRVFDKQVSVNRMNYEILSGMADFTNDEFTTTTANGKAIMYSFIDEKSEGASLSFNVLNNPGEAVFGLLNLKSTIVSKTDLYHGFVVNGTTASIVASGVTTGPYTVGPSDEYVIAKEGSNMNFYISGVLKQSTALPGTFIYKTGVFATISNTKIKFKPRKVKPLMLAWNKITEILPGSCMGSFGKVSGSLSSFTFFNTSMTGFNAVLTSAATGLPQTMDVESTTANYSFSNLLPGTYTLTTSFYWTGNPTPVVFNTTVFVSTKVAWENIVNTTDVPAGSILSTSTANGYASSVNQLTGDGYIDFGVRLGGYVLSTFGAFTFLTPVGNGITWMGFYNGNSITNTLASGFTGYRFYKTGFTPYSLIPYQGGSPIGSAITFVHSDRFRFVYNATSKQGSLYKLLSNGSLGAQIPGTVIQYPTSPASEFVKKAMVYLSPNFTGRGFIDVSTNMPCPADFVYAKLERELLGVKYKTYLNKFYFFYDEEYASTAALTYNVYDFNNQVVLKETTQQLSNPTGNVNPITNQIINREYGDNRYSIDVTSLPAGSYVLEVINEKSEKLYLRFIK